MRIDILVGQNDYGVVRVFSEGLRKALLRTGAEVRTFSVAPSRFYKVMNVLISDPPDLTISLTHIRVGSLPLAAVSATPHLTWILDPAYYFLDLAPPQRSLIATVDEEDAMMLAAHAGPRVLFLPHAVEKEFAEKPFDKVRNHEIVFFGTHLDPEEVRSRWDDKFKSQERAFLEECCERVLQEPNLSLLSALLEKGPQASLPILFSEGDFYLRSKERLGLMKALDSPQLHIFGKGDWGAAIKKAQVYSEISFGAAKALMRKSKIVINSSLRFKYGLHERILYAAGCGALPISTHSAGFDKAFGDKKGFFSFKYGAWDELNDMVHGLLKDSGKREELAMHAREEVLLNHTFDVRAAHMIQWLQTSFGLQAH